MVFSVKASKEGISTLGRILRITVGSLLGKITDCLGRYRHSIAAFSQAIDLHVPQFRVGKGEILILIVHHGGHGCQHRLGGIPPNVFPTARKWPHDGVRDILPSNGPGTDFVGEDISCGDAIFCDH